MALIFWGYLSIQRKVCGTIEHYIVGVGRIIATQLQKPCSTQLAS